MRSISASRPAPRRTISLLAGAAAAALLTGCMLFARPPQDLDYSRTRASGNGLYRATIRPAGDTVPQGKLHNWVIRIEAADGTPVDLCKVTVDGGMPQHGHGLPTKPRVTKRLGDGEHLVEGMKFNMGGWWVVKFRVASAAGEDSVAFNLSL